MKKVVFILCAFFAVSRPLFAAPAAETTPAMDLLKAWSPVEAALAEDDPWERAPLGQDLRSAVAAFKQSLEGFISTPLYAEFAGKGLIENRDDVLALAGGLSAAVEAGNRAETARAAAVIREKLFAWQGIELRASGQALLRLFLFFIVFILISCSLVLLIVLLHRVLLRSRIQEQDSAAFSRMIMLAQETERSRIAAELHDAVLPDLRDNPAAARIREICGRLMPPDLTRFSLKDSLLSLCDTFVKRTGIECIIEIEEDLDFSRLSGEHQLHLYRIAQEALNNTGKHSRAKQASLVARYGGGEPSVDGKGRPILLSISDDGVGLRSMPGLRSIPGLPGKYDGGIGMRTMRRRAAIIGARINFISEEGNGLMVCVELSPPPPHTRSLSHEQHRYCRRSSCYAQRTGRVVCRNRTLADFRDRRRSCGGQGTAFTESGAA